MQTVIYTPEQKIDIAFLSEVKTLIHINIPIHKIKSLDFILFLPKLKTIGDYLDNKTDIYNPNQIKKTLKYRKNIKMLIETCITS